MKKVVVERPRWGSRQRNRKFGARLKYVPDHDYDEQPKKPRGFESYGSRGKEFTDVLGPLEGFLRKNVGRPWDKIYSELCSGLDKRKVTGQHIFVHVKQMVETHCFMGANEKVCHLRWGREQVLVKGLYVHPKTGLLCWAEPPNKRELKRRRLLAEEVTWLTSTNEIGFRKHEGIWYRVQYRRVYVDWRRQPEKVRDIFLKKDALLNHGWNLVPLAKKQCNRDELNRVRYLLWQRERRIRNS